MKNDDMIQIFEGLNSEQIEACLKEENILLTASPGSGKTRVITHKIAYLSEKYKPSKLYNIAITFTNRAAYELESRLYDMGIESGSFWCGTIHQFCMNFIIKPYSMYHVNLSKGFTIIDEYIEIEYKKDIAKELGLSLIFYEHSFEETQLINEHYRQKLIDNREIDFNKILKYSLELVKNNHFIAESIGKLIRSINVDEYQDTQNIQYKILSYIFSSNPDILLMFVGDINQSIYTNLGSEAKSIDELKYMYNTNFLPKTLSGCYRSSQRIIDYYLQFENNESNTYSLSEFKSANGEIKYTYDIYKDNLASEICKVIQNEINKGTPEEEICVVAPQWYLLFPIADQLKLRLPGIKLNAPDITIAKYNPNNLFYLIFWLTFTRNQKNSFLRRKFSKQIIDILETEYSIYLREKYDYLDILFVINSINYIGTAIDTLKTVFKEFISFYNLNINEKLINNKNSFIDQVESRVRRHNLNTTCETVVKSLSPKDGVTISSIHGIKGEEYKTVIAFGLLKGLLPNWNMILDKNNSDQFIKLETNNLLYVLASRSKLNLYLFSEVGRTTKKGFNLVPTSELNMYTYDYD